MNKKSKIIKLNNDMHHCSSITQDNNGNYIIVLYNGAECQDQQHVVILLYDNNQVLLDKIELSGKTGNPIVWNDNGNIKIIYSYFSDSDINGNKYLITRPVERWMYCNNFISSIFTDNNEIILGEAIEIDGAYGHLARCQPLLIDGKTLIPMYRERDPRCFIWEYNDGIISLKSDFGDVDKSIKNVFYSYLGEGVAIQPTLVKDGNKLRAFCRNVSRPTALNDSKFAWQTYSDDGGISWHPLTTCGIPNHNNSIVAFSSPTNKNSMMFLFNSDRRRNDLLLFESKSKIVLNLANPSARSRNSFSYPNYMLDNDGNLHVVHTNCGKIMWHTFDEEFLYETFKI
jgi:hypothetical protein